MMAIYYTLNSGEPYTKAREVFFAVHALKSAKQFIGVRQVKTSAIILNKIRCAPIGLRSRAEFYFCGGMM
jgi:hypothetical protein